MIVELTAGRLISRYLGQSLYTWTSVIGVVLAGISVGNYLGGWIADRSGARHTLAALLALSALACVLVPPLNHGAGRCPFLWELSWPFRIFLHVLVTFLLPSVLLGTISPVVAKMALEGRSDVGRTIGAIYAWGAAGSIAGTFLAGFWLIGTIGTAAVILLVAAVLGGMAVVWGRRRWFSYVGLAAALAAALATFAPGSAAAHVGTRLLFRDPDASQRLYQDESHYSYIAVKALDPAGRVRGLYLDKMMHSLVDITSPTQLLYRYTWVYEAVVDMLAQPGRPVTALVIGGGGFVFPQYLILTRPGSLVDVAEIDPRVTRAAREAFGLRAHPGLRIHHLDARNFVADQLRRAQRGEEVVRYQFVFGDSINDYSVPYHLTTREFARDLRRLMTDDGVYLLNLIDRWDSGRFLAAVLRTCREVFRSVNVVYCHRNLNCRGTYVVICADRNLHLSDLEERIRSRHDFHGRVLAEEDLDILLSRTAVPVLTDDFAPVENLLADVVRKDRPEGLDLYYLNRALQRLRRGDLRRGLRLLQKAAEANPGNPEVAYNMGVVLMRMDRLDEALAAFLAAGHLAPDHAAAANNAAVVLTRMGRWEDAATLLARFVREHPDEVTARVNLASVLASLGKVEAAEKELRQVLELTPNSALAHNAMGEVLAASGRKAEAASYFRRALELDPSLRAAQKNLARWAPD